MSEERGWNQLDQNEKSRRRARIQQWWHWRCSPSSGWPSRRQAFQIMQEAGVPTLPWGSWSEMAQRFPGRELVIYHDQMLHAAEGKSLWKPGQAAPANEMLATPLMTTGSSVRILRIGHRLMTLIYRSEDSWMSNEGAEGSIDLIEGPRWPWQMAIDSVARPIWAIDMVAEPGSPAARWLSNRERDAPPPAGGFLACDLNLAPGIQGTGLHQSLGGTIVEALASSGFHPSSERRPWPAEQEEKHE